MSPFASALLRLYPRAWRRRYGAEMQALLREQKLSPRTVLDLVAGAIDARTHPQLRTAVQAEGGMTMKQSMCYPAGVSKEDTWRSAGWMVGGSLVLTVLATLLRMHLGPNVLSEGLIYAAFPASLMLSMECTYLKRYSGVSRAVISGGGALLIILMMWVSVAIGNRI
jgi:hypothetical protein